MEMRAPRGQIVTTVCPFLFYKCVFDKMSMWVSGITIFHSVFLIFILVVLCDPILVCPNPPLNSTFNHSIANKWYQSLRF